MGLKPPLNEPHGSIRNAANEPKKESHHNPARNAATIARGPGDVPTESYICNESTPMQSPHLKPMASKIDLGKGSPRPNLTGQDTYGPTGANPAETPLSKLKYAEIRKTTRTSSKSSPPY